MILEVNNIILDQFENTIIAQTFSTNDFGDLTTRNGGFSNKFKLPLTAKNRGALGFPDDLNVFNDNPYTKVDATLKDVSSVIALGYLKYRVVTDKNIECVFFSDNTDWFNLIKDKKLTDLDLSDLNHFWNYFFISQAMNNDFDYTYPIIDYGEFGQVDSEDTTLYVNDTSFYPSLKLSRLVNQCYEDIGFNVTGSLFSDDRFIRSILPFSAESFSRSAEFVEALQVLEFENGTPDLTNLNPSELVLWGAGSSIVNVPETGNYNINIFYEGLRSSPQVGVDVKLEIFYYNGATDKLLGVFNYDPSDTGTFSLNVNSTISVNAFQGVQIRIVLSTLSSIVLETLNTTSITLTPLQEITSSTQVIEMSQTLPDISQEDFLKWIFFSWGVVPQVDNFSKTVRLDLFKDVEDNIPNALDWSNKLDISQDYNTDFTKLLNNYASNSIITYIEDDDDQTLSQYKSENEQILGQGSLVINNEHIRQESTIYEAPFASSININSFTNNLYIPKIAFLEFNDGVFEREIEPKPKVLLNNIFTGLDDLTGNKYNTLQINESKGTQAFCGINASGSVNSVELVQESQYAAYANTASVLIIVSPPDLDTGTRAEVSANFVSGFITSFNIDVAGSGYFSPPKIFIYDTLVNDVTSNVPWAWFAKTAYIQSIDSIDLSLSYGNIQFPTIGSNMKETYLEDQENILSNMKYLSAYFRLNEVDLNALDFLTPVYIDRFKSYFYINVIKDYQGSNKSTKVELIKIR